MVHEDWAIIVNKSWVTKTLCHILQIKTWPNKEEEEITDSVISQEFVENHLLGVMYVTKYEGKYSFELLRSFWYLS